MKKSAAARVSEIETDKVTDRRNNTPANEQNSDWKDEKEEEPPAREVTNRELISDSKEKLVIMKAYHDSPFGGHFGAAKTYARIKPQYY